MVESKQLSTNEKFHVFAGEIHLAATVFRRGQTFKILYVLPPCTFGNTHIHS